jgi:hypothetical protein
MAHGAQAVEPMLLPRVVVCSCRWEGPVAIDNSMRHAPCVVCETAGAPSAVGAGGSAAFIPAPCPRSKRSFRCQHTVQLAATATCRSKHGRGDGIACSWHRPLRAPATTGVLCPGGAMELESCLPKLFLLGGGGGGCFDSSHASWVRSRCSSLYPPACHPVAVGVRSLGFLFMPCASGPKRGGSTGCLCGPCQTCEESL